MKKVLFIVIVAVILIALMSSPAVAKQQPPSVTYGDEYEYTQINPLVILIHGCYYGIGGTVYAACYGICSWTCTEFEDDSVRQSSVTNGLADIYSLVDLDGDGFPDLLEGNVPSNINKDFFDADGTKTVKTAEGYYEIPYESDNWTSLGEYHYHINIEGRFEKEYELRKNGHWSWWSIAGECSNSDRGKPSKEKSH